MAPNLHGGLRRSTRTFGTSLRIGAGFRRCVISPGGQFVVKVFQGEGFMEYRKQMEMAFVSVQVKPKASRDRSAEVYSRRPGPRRP